MKTGGGAVKTTESLQIFHQAEKTKQQQRNHDTKRKKGEKF